MSLRKRHCIFAFLAVALVAGWYFLRATSVPEVAPGSLVSEASVSGQPGMNALTANTFPAIQAPVVRESAKQQAFKRFTEAPALESRTLPADAQGKYSVQKLIRREGTYPLLRLEQDFATGQPDHPTAWRAMVADHFMVKLRDGISEEALTNWAHRIGLNIRKHLSDSPFYLVGLPSGNLEAFDKALAQLNQEHLPIEYAE